jgi:TolB-like protein/class 3 adenylate cyclase/Tfp pilus assembly protein PilF
MSTETGKVAQAETRKLAAIMFTDMVGFSRQMGANEARMLRLLDIHNHIIQQAVAEHHGTVIKTVGDAFLVDFPSVVHAVQCAQQIQAQFRVHNAEKELAEQIHVRIGVHLGDVVQREGDVFGDGVNIAKRLQELAEPDTICLSQVVYQEVAKKLDLGTRVSLGQPKLKNIAERFQIYALLPEPPRGIRQTLGVQWLKLSRQVGTAHLSWVVVGLLLITGTVVAVRYLVLPTSSTQSPTPNTLHTTPYIQPALTLPDKPSIVVLPFDNMSGDSGQDYFSNGITEVLTSDLSRIASLFVIARNTAFTYKGKATNVQEVGKELGVRYVLEGSVQKTDMQVRIVTQLSDTATGGHIWSERYDRPLTDLFALQDDIVQQIVTTLGLQLTLEEHGYIVRKRTDNLEAYDSVLRGQEHFWHFTNESAAQARQMFERALVLDPQYAEAYAFLGWTYWTEWIFHWSADPQTLERALAMAQQAVALDDSLPRAHSLLSNVYSLRQQYESAIAEGKRAIALDPNHADSYAYQAQALNFAGRPKEALPVAEQARRLNPHSPPFYLFELGWAYRLTGRYAEAVAALEETINQSPNFLPAHFNLAASYVDQWAFQQNPNFQLLAQALAAAQRLLALDGPFPPGHRMLGYVYLWQKQYELALAEMERAIVLDPNEASGYALLAETLSRVGRSEEVVTMVEQALRRKPLGVDVHLNSVGTAYYLAGRAEEAVAPLKQFLSHYPDILSAHLSLAAVYSELGKEAEARAEAAEVLRINPHFSLDVYKQRAPIKDPAVLERHLAALHKAGLK